MNNYIFKLKNNLTYHFYYEKPNKFQFRKTLSDNTWSKPTSLITDTTESISLTADYNDTFHIIYQNTTGSIIYSTFDGSNLKVYEMLKSRTNEIYDRYFKIVHSGNTVNFFYVLRKDNNSSIIYQCLQNSEFSMPKVIAPSISSPINFEVLQEPSRNLHLLYLNSDIISHKKFVSELHSWHELGDISCNKKLINNFSACINKNSNISIAYQSQDSDNSTSLIIKHLQNKEKIFEEYNITKFPKAHKYIEITPLLDDIILCYYDSSNYYMNYIQKFKLLWEQPKKIPIGNHKLSQYTSYYPYENIHIANTLLNNTNGISVPILQKLNLDIIYKKMQEDEISMLKHRMNNIEKAIFDRNNEIEKLLIRMKYLENRR